MIINLLNILYIALVKYVNFARIQIAIAKYLPLWI
jgi:hypothetical protein